MIHTYLHWVWQLIYIVSFCWFQSVPSPPPIKVRWPIGLFFDFSTSQTNLISQANRHLSWHFKLTLSRHATLMSHLTCRYVHLTSHCSLLPFHSQSIPRNKTPFSEVSWLMTTREFCVNLVSWQRLVFVLIVEVINAISLPLFILFPSLPGVSILWGECFVDHSVVLDYFSML